MAAFHDAEAPVDAASQAENKTDQKKKAKGAKRKSRKRGSRTSSKASAAAMVRISGEQLPRKTLEQALRIPKALRDVHAGGPAEWRDIARATNLSMSQPNKYYLWAAQAYGLVEKDGDKFSITETARKILAPTRPNEDKEAIVKAVLTPVVFSRFFTDYNSSPFPADEHIGNVLEVRYGIPRERVEEAKTLIKDNGLFASILHLENDGTMLVRLDSSAPSRPVPLPAEAGTSDQNTTTAVTAATGDFANMCFVITPIGDDDSEQRKHADLILKSIIEPVASELGLVPRRADQIDRSGIITQQIFECLAKARVSVADLSFNNPNAFYELGIRHMCKMPTIQIIRKGDKIPFDVSQGRTIKVDMTDVYSVFDSIESAKRELREHLRHAISSDYKGEDNPVNVYLPAVVVNIPSR
jgi:hypothetical protein